MELKNIDSLIFDLDGTLWDASNSCTKAWNETLRQLGNENVVLDEATIRSYIGLKIEKILEQYFDFIPKNKHEELLVLYKVNEKNFMKKFGGQLFPDVKKVLAELKKNYKLFIVSNCLVGYIENFIEFNGFQNMFTDFESSGNTGLAKSDNIKLITERNRLENPIYVGDTFWDYEAAQIANIPFIYAAYGFGQIHHSVCKIEEFMELKKLLKT